MAIYSWFSHWKWWFSIAMLVYQRVDCWMMLFPRRPDEWLRLGWTRRLPAKPVELGLFFLAVKLTGHGHLDQLLGSRKVHRPRAAPLFWAFFFEMNIVWLHRKMVKMVKMVKKGTSSDFLWVCEKYLTWNFYETKMLKLVTHRILVVIHGSPEPHRGPRNGLSRSDATGWWRTDPWMAERKQRYGINMEISMGKAIYKVVMFIGEIMINHLTGIVCCIPTMPCFSWDSLNCWRISPYSVNCWSLSKHISILSAITQTNPLFE